MIPPFDPTAAPTQPRIVIPTSLPRLAVVVATEAGAAVHREVDFGGEVLRIGAHPSNELVLRDPTVSRFHCRIERGPAGWRVVDEQSLNGTHVDGVRVRDADLPMPECSVRVGESKILLSDAGAPASAALTSGIAFGAIYGAAPSMRGLYSMLQKVAPRDVTVLIEGESGTGKELVASELVRRGPRAKKPFVVVDCGSIPPALLESALFGHARGAFTGATRARIGAFEAASGGTLFLDEIGELPLEMQPKLLRAIDAGEIRRLGETSVRTLDVRVIAATNRRLEREVNHGRFREDLFFRLSVVTVRVPPLRQRASDIPLLVDAFLAELGAMDKRHLFTRELLETLSRHDWPGNVRELKNFVERRVVLEDTAVVPGEDPEVRRKPGPIVRFREAKEEAIRAFEREYLAELLASSQGNVSLAARTAAMDRMHLHRLLQQHGLRKDGSLAD
ncbi:MAG: sigma 54-interacting transcriptional regulator [Polyangiaceae bacterium]